MTNEQITKLKQACDILIDLVEQIQCDTIPIQTISQEEYDVLMEDLDGYGHIVKSIQKFYEIDTLEKLPKSALKSTREKIRKIKAAMEKYDV